MPSGGTFITQHDSGGHVHKTSFTRFLVVAIIALASVALADDKPLTNDDIIKLTSAGVPADVIVAKIRTSAGTFDTSADALLLLSKAGVGEAVLNAMMSAAARPSSNPASSPATDCANLPPPSIATGTFFVVKAISGPQRTTKPLQDTVGVFTTGMCLWNCSLPEGRWGFDWENVTSACLRDEPTAIETRAGKSGATRLELHFTRDDEPHVVKLWDLLHRDTNSIWKAVPMAELFNEISRLAKRCIPCQQP